MVFIFLNPINFLFYCLYRFIVAKKSIFVLIKIWPLTKLGNLNWIGISVKYLAIPIRQEVRVGFAFPPLDWYKDHKSQRYLIARCNTIVPMVVRLEYACNSCFIAARFTIESTYHTIHLYTSLSQYLTWESPLRRSEEVVERTFSYLQQQKKRRIYYYKFIWYTNKTRKTWTWLKKKSSSLQMKVHRHNRTLSSSSDNKVSLKINPTHCYLIGFKMQFIEKNEGDSVFSKKNIILYCEKQRKTFNCFGYLKNFSNRVIKIHSQAIFNGIKVIKDGTVKR